MKRNNQSKKASEEDTIRWLLSLHRLIFGKNEPDVYTKITFFINILLWVLFFSHVILQWVSIQFSDLLETHKQLNLIQLIKQRGTAIGFDGEEFLVQLLSFLQISAIGLLSIFIGLILLWRKKMIFTLFFFGGTILILCTILFLLGATYLNQDIPYFLKTLFLLWNINSVIYAFLLFRGNKNGEISFFEDQANQ